MHNSHRTGRLLLLTIAAGVLAACIRLDNGQSDGRVWGSGDAGLVNGSASEARFSNPVNVEVASDGIVYVADYDNDAIRTIQPNGNVTTLVRGTGFSRPFGLTIGVDGFLYVETDANDSGLRDLDTGTIWRVDRGTGAASVVVRNVGRPRGLQALTDGRIAMSDPVHDVLSILDPASGAIEPLAGARDVSDYRDGSGGAARFSQPYGLALADGALLVADQGNNRIRRVTLDGVVTTFAGDGVAGNNGGNAATARFRLPQDLAFSGSRIYISDHGNHTIRRISGGTVDVEAGDGQQGFVDADGTAAEFFGLEGIALTADGRVLWVADGNNGEGDPFNRVRRIELR